MHEEHKRVPSVAGHDLLRRIATDPVIYMDGEREAARRALVEIERLRADHARVWSRVWELTRPGAPLDDLRPLEEALRGLMRKERGDA
jgi:hypothetical protein